VRSLLRGELVKASDIFIAPFRALPLIGRMRQKAALLDSKYY